MLNGKIVILPSLLFNIFWEYLQMQLNRKKMKYKNEKERSEWQLFVDDLTAVFFSSGCHNKLHRWGASSNRNYFSGGSGGWK